MNERRTEDKRTNYITCEAQNRKKGFSEGSPRWGSNPIDTLGRHRFYRCAMVASEVVHFACTQFSSKCMYYSDSFSIVDKQLSTSSAPEEDGSNRGASLTNGLV